MKRTGLIFIGLLFCFSNSAMAQTLNPNDDLVVPLGDSQREQNKIETNEPISMDSEKKSLGSKGIIRDDNEGHHLRLVPKYSGTEEPTLQKKTKKGEYLYRVPPSTHRSATWVHGGPFYPSLLLGDRDGITFQNIYGSKNVPFVQIDYEYQLIQSIGKLALKGGFGFISTQGQGRFKSRPDTVADETITFYSFPLNLSAVYRAQFAQRQLVIPFGEAGMDYFDFAEYRPDKKGLSAYRFAGALASHVAGGLQIQLDFLDKEGLWQLDSEYGINHIYFVAAGRRIFGLSSTFDFSATLFEGGFLVEF